MVLRCICMLVLLAATAAAQVPRDTMEMGDTSHLDPALSPRLALQHAADLLPLEDAEEEAEASRWHVFMALVNSYPRLESEKLIDDLLEPMVKVIAPGFDDFYTVGDLRDQGLVLPPHIGIGYKLSDYWGIFIQGGYSSGKVRTDEDDTSIFLLPFHTDLEIKRGAAYLGVGLDYYPWKQPERRHFENWGQRLKAARPTLGIRYTWTYATYAAKVRLQLRPFPNLGIRLEDAWLVPSINLNVGLEVPVNEHNILFGNAGYAFFDKQRQDFEGPAFTLGWKFMF